MNSTLDYKRVEDTFVDYSKHSFFSGGDLCPLLYTPVPMPNLKEHHAKVIRKKEGYGEIQIGKYRSCKEPQQHFRRKRMKQ